MIISIVFSFPYRFASRDKIIFASQFSVVCDGVHRSLMWDKERFFLLTSKETHQKKLKQAILWAVSFQWTSILTFRYYWLKNIYVNSPSLFHNISTIVTQEPGVLIYNPSNQYSNHSISSILEKNIWLNSICKLVFVASQSVFISTSAVSSELLC